MHFFIFTVSILQLAVFRLLLPHWLAFREYHKRMGNEERILSTLDRHRAVALTKEKKFREELTKQREIVTYCDVILENLYLCHHGKLIILFFFCV